MSRLTLLISHLSSLENTSLMPEKRPSSSISQRNSNEIVIFAISIDFSCFSFDDF
jgi:hypothetical protein